MLIRLFLLFFVTSFLFSCKNENQKVQWRGEDRGGKYSEKNLLKSWKSEGPDVMWSYYGVGNGYGSPVVTSDRLFVMGEIDSLGYLFSFDKNGKFLWKSSYGKEWTKNFPGSRSTPTVYNGLIYLVSGLGKIVCFDEENGKEIWTSDLIKSFSGINVRFGYSESLAVDDLNVYCSTGAADSNVVAFDRLTGKINWISKATGEETSYCSPLLIKLATRSILVSFAKNSFFGLDTKDGKLLWSHKQDNDGDIHGNTPIYDNGFLYYVSVAGNGTVKLELSADGSSIKEVWRNTKFGNAFGGFVKVGDFIYCSGYEPKQWGSVDLKSGMVTDSLKFERGITIFADSMLYCYNEKGEMGLVNISAGKMTMVSSFKIKKGTAEHFAHPVISDGILYVRHGKALLAYNIRKQ